MANVIKIHTDKTPPRIHYIPEWLEHRGLIQADVVRELGVNKGTVSKWCKGELPQETNLRQLASFLGIEPLEIFRHPLDDWMARFFMNRSTEQLKRIVETLKVAFPRGDDLSDSKAGDETGSGAPRHPTKTRSKGAKRPNSH